MSYLASHPHYGSAIYTRTRRASRTSWARCALRGASQTTLLLIIGARWASQLLTILTILGGEITPFERWLYLVVIVNQTKHGAQVVWRAWFAVCLEFLTTEVIIGARRAQHGLYASLRAVLPSRTCCAFLLSLLLLKGASRAWHLLIVLHSCDGAHVARHAKQG